MRKTNLTLLLLVVSMLVTLGLKAQVTFGVKAGLNFAKFLTKSDGITEKSDALTGFHTGVLVVIPISENFFVQPELLYSAKGGSTTYEGDRYSLNYSYAELPINLKYKFPINETINIFGATGPYVGYLISAKGKLNNSSADAKELMKDLDYGFKIGTGAEIKNFIIGIQYELGLANISNSNGINMNHRVFGVSLGYLFGRKD